MIYAIILLSLALVASLAANKTQFEEINELRNRLYGAEEWIDPVMMEGDDERY